MLIFHGKVGLVEIEMVSPSLSHELDTGCKAMLHALQPIESLDDHLELQPSVQLQCDKVRFSESLRQIAQTFRLCLFEFCHPPCLDRDV